MPDLRTKQCEVCKKNFSRKYRSEKRWKKSIVCSNVCLYKSSARGITWKNKLSSSHKGQFVSDETKKKLSISHQGQIAWNKGLKFPNKEKHPRWKKDRSTLAKKQERNDCAYQEWRRQVWLRDSFKCKIANPDCKGRIEAHHILSWRDYPELRYQINNGITLCHAHHPRKRAEEKRLSPYFQELVSVSKEII